MFLSIPLKTTATNIFGPETTMPGAAPDGNNPLQTNNGGTATKSTISTANGGDGEMVTMKTKSFAIAPPLQGGNAANAQVIVSEKDTSVVNGQQDNVRAINLKKEQKFRKEADEINNSSDK